MKDAKEYLTHLNQSAKDKNSNRKLKHSYFIPTTSPQHYEVIDEIYKDYKKQDLDNLNLLFPDINGGKRNKNIENR